MNIGTRLKEERERLGLSQTDLADRVGVTRKSQFNYESGERLPDAGYLVALAAAGADPQYVLLGQRSSTALPPDEQRLLALYRLADAGVRKAVIGALAVGETPAVVAVSTPAPTRVRKGSVDVVIHGEVGQQFHGNHPGATFHVDMAGDKTKK